jgi:hypothetical protein
MDFGIVGKSKWTLKRRIIVVGILMVLSNSTKIIPLSNFTKSQISNNLGLSITLKKISTKSGVGNFLL